MNLISILQKPSGLGQCGDPEYESTHSSPRRIPRFPSVGGRRDRWRCPPGSWTQIPPDPEHHILHWTGNARRRQGNPRFSSEDSWKAKYISWLKLFQSTCNHVAILITSRITSQNHTILESHLTSHYNYLLFPYWKWEGSVSPSSALLVESRPVKR